MSIAPNPCSNASRFDGMAAEYDRYRPRTPEALLPLLCRYAGCERPARVVDLGCGTGISTRIWAALAGEVIGIDASRDMLDQAEARGAPGNLQYCLGEAARTGLPAASVDVVVAVQSFHWMEPRATLAEVGRILRPGGVFAAVDTRFPPAIHWELDVAFDRHLLAVESAEAELGLALDTPRWSKEGHLDRMARSGAFRFVRELELHGMESGDAARFLGFARTATRVDALLARGLSEARLGLDDLREAAARAIGGRTVDWHFGFRVRMGVR
ncbi:MAG TPA: class I SAM-dependent methyltransferase [Sorangium sp.]|nr:class I SAM-dependent methyltransferase [Sorangium sp.]